MCHMSGVTCHVSGVTCQVSHVRCHVSGVTCLPRLVFPIEKSRQAPTRENIYYSVYSKTVLGIVSTAVNSATHGVRPGPASLVTTLRSWAVETSPIRPPSGVVRDTTRARGTGTLHKELSDARRRRIKIALQKEATREVLEGGEALEGWLPD